jgi:hypothetical protein
MRRERGTGTEEDVVGLHAADGAGARAVGRPTPLYIADPERIFFPLLSAIS